MNIFYTMGAGWGHLRRVQVFIQNEGITDYRILTTNRLASKIFPDNIIWKSVLMPDDSVGTLYIDTFPCGIRGELKNIGLPKGVSINVLCRRIKWDVYKKHANEMPINEAFIMEELEQEHFRYIFNNSKEMNPYHLDYSKPGLNQDVISGLNIFRYKCLIVHGYIKNEVEELCRIALDHAAKEPGNHQVILISDQDVDIEGIERIEHFPASDYFPYVNKIFSGCGFNIMQETKEFRDKQVIIPFERVYDDQFWRYNQLKDG